MLYLNTILLVDACPDKYCIPDNSIKCFIDNQKPLCECKPDFYGITCEISQDRKEEAVIIIVNAIFNQTKVDYNVISGILTVSNLLKTDEALINNIAITSSQVVTSANIILENTEIIKQETITYICFSLNLLRLR